MAAEARISSTWSMQKLFISLFFMGIGSWFFFDGLVKWPRSNERWLAQQRFEKEGRLAEWPAYAAERGWVKTKPEKFYDAGAIGAQYVFGGLAVAVGLLLLIFWFTQRDRVLRTDQEAIYSPGGNRVPFSCVVGIGKKRWESKGLATVRYEEKGRKGQFLVDDYKFETEPARQILAEIEAHLLARTSGEPRLETRAEEV